MAQTSTRGNSQARRRTTGRSNGSGRSAASSRRSSSARSRQRRNGTSGPRSQASGAARGGSGKAISTVAEKVKGPALAAGAALAGVAGGMALQSKRESGRKVLGLRVGKGVGDIGRNLADAGQSAGRFTENLGTFAAEMRKTREAIEERPAKHRSPIEVVLQALTARR
jgi:hypothetical protein